MASEVIPEEVEINQLIDGYSLCGMSEELLKELPRCDAFLRVTA